MAMRRIEEEVGLEGNELVNFEALRFLRIAPQDDRFEDVQIDIRIYKVIAPTHFYFHIESSYHELVGLEREMADFYDENPSVKYPQDKDSPVVPFEFYGFYSKCKRRWVRVLKDGLHDKKNGFNVVLIDYGEKEFVANENMLRFLPDQFCDLQGQGYQGQLYVEDEELDRNWTEAETCSFREKVLNRKLSITPIGFNADHPFMPECCVFIQVDVPCGESMYLGGVYPYGTETPPTQRANIEVFRVLNNIWTKRCF